MSAAEYQGWREFAQEQPLPGELTPRLLATLCAIVRGLAGSSRLTPDDFLPESWRSAPVEVDPKNMQALARQAESMARMYHRATGKGGVRGG